MPEKGMPGQERPGVIRVWDMCSGEGDLVAARICQMWEAVTV